MGSGLMSAQMAYRLPRFQIVRGPQCPQCGSGRPIAAGSDQLLACAPCLRAAAEQIEAAEKMPR